MDFKSKVHFGSSNNFAEYKDKGAATRFTSGAAEPHSNMVLGKTPGGGVKFPGAGVIGSGGVGGAPGLQAEISGKFSTKEAFTPAITENLPAYRNLQERSAEVVAPPSTLVRPNYEGIVHKIVISNFAF